MPSGTAASRRQKQAIDAIAMVPVERDSSPIPYDCPQLSIDERRRHVAPSPAEQPMHGSVG